MAVKGFITISEAGGTYTLTRTAAPDAGARLSGDERAIADALALGTPGSSIALQRANRSSIQASVSAFQGWLRQSVEHAYFRTHRFWAYGGVLVIGAAGVAAAALSDARDARRLP